MGSTSYSPKYYSFSMTKETAEAMWKALQAIHENKAHITVDHL